MAKLDWSINLNPTRLSPTLELDALYRNGDRALEQLQDLGVGYVRVDVRWGLIEPEPGRYSEEAIAWYKHFLSRLVAGGVKIYAILYNPPIWACDQSASDLEGFHAAWRKFCRLCAREFGEWIQLWQVWNEPNNYVSHLKDDFNLFHTRTFSLGGWKVTLPVAVHWQALVPLFRIAREELGSDALIAYNVIASVSDYTPVTYPGWTEWDHFTEQLLERAGDAIDVLALDHYPDTWIPGVGALAWDPIEAIAKKVHDPKTAWYGKTVILGEIGYSSCSNVDLIRRPRVRFFPEDHSDETMRDWYAQAIPYLSDRMDPVKWPHNRLHLANVYELYDAEVGEILGGQHAEVIGIEYHFGLVRNDGSTKPAYHVFQDHIRGTTLPATAPRRKTPTHPLRLYMQGSAASKALHRHASPMIYALYQALRPPLRRHDAGVLSMGAVLVLYQLWRAATRAAK